MRAPAMRKCAKSLARDTLVVMRSARVAVVLDVCCVLVFVAIGRASHTKGEALAGIASTSWPFLCGLAAGWAASRAWRRPLALRPAGLAVWLNLLDGQIAHALNPIRHRPRAAATAASLVHGIPGLDTLTAATRAVSGAR